MIDLKHVQNVVGANTLVDIDTLSIQPGEIAAIVGLPGSGENELLSLLSGQTRPTSGSVRVAGLDPSLDHAKSSQHIGVLFPENGLYERQSCRANLVFYCRLRGLPVRRADEVLEQVGLADHFASQVSSLPAGLARRLAFGRVILHQPAVLLLMKPFAGCDSASTALLTRLIQELSEGGTTVLILATELTGLSHLCRTIHFLEQGHIVRSETPQDDRRSELPFKVPARQEGQVVLVNLADILYASADEGQTYLHTPQGTVPSHLTLTELEERLSRNGFFRAHRAYLVNLQRVKSIIPYTRDSFTLILDDPQGTEIPLSKTSARDLKDLLGY
jgi:ABC-2 type transport system ATP-binding protein